LGTMTKDFSELVEYLDKKFTGIDERFDGIDERFETTDSRLNDLANGLQSVNDHLGAVKQDLRDLRDDFVKLQDGVDGYAKKADIYFQEMLMFAGKVDRHEKWLHQVAEKLGLKLEY
jgi:septation ring formation regulator EzrA